MTWPLSGLTWPDAIFIIVDLPAPFSPASAVTVPAARVRETPFSTGTPPNALVRSRHSNATSSTSDLQTRALTARCAARSWSPVHLQAPERGSVFVRVNFTRSDIAVSSVCCVFVTEQMGGDVGEQGEQ